MCPVDSSIISGRSLDYFFYSYDLLQFKWLSWSQSLIIVFITRLFVVFVCSVLVFVICFYNFLQMDVYDAAERYRQEGRQLIILAGKDYGSGSSRDWAAKGPWMQVNIGCVGNRTVSFTHAT